jgi:hypothetical protein
MADPNKPDKATMPGWDLRGNKITVEVNLIADARGVVGLAGYPWIIMAANPQLSNVLIERYLGNCGIDGAERSLSWIQRRRWMFRTVEPGNTNGPKSDTDGNQARAVRIMRENTNLSARQLSRLLRENRIIRSREWVRKHRCDPENVTPKSD